MGDNQTFVRVLICTMLEFEISYLSQPQCFVQNNFSISMVTLLTLISEGRDADRSSLTSTAAAPSGVVIVWSLMPSKCHVSRVKPVESTKATVTERLA